MPRKSKHSPIQGAYENRSDLNTAPAQPVKVPTGGPYGAAKASAAAQAAVPLPDNQAAFSSALQAALASSPPGSSMIGAPDDRPDLPVTSGLDVGAGSGSEVLSPLAPGVDTAAIFRALADATGDVEFELLAQRAEAAGA